MGKKLGGALLGAVVATGLAFATGGASIAATTGLFGIGAGTVGGFFLRQLAINAVLGFVSSALAPKSSSSAANQLAGQLIASRNPIASRKIAYGEVRTAGTIVFVEVSGDENKYLHQITTLAGHEISAVKEVYLNEQLVKTNLVDSTEVSADSGTTPDYSSFVVMTAHFGSPTQVADANLVTRTSITTEHRLREIAYIYTRCEYDQDTFVSGAPNVSALIQGKKVYDPRTTTTEYSNNAALCILDYLRDSKYGLGAADDEIDFASFITAANICDENVTLDAGGTEKRYTINGLIDSAQTPSSILQEMAAACAGTVYYTNGKWHLKAGAYITPVHTLTEDDFIGGIDITTRVSNQSNFNAIKGIFPSPSDDWQPVDYPPVTSATFEAEDNNERRYADMALPFTTSSARAQRIAKIALYRNREQLTVSVACKLTAFRFDIGDTLMLTNARMGWTNKVFEVVAWQYQESAGLPAVILTLKETSSAVYQWAAVDESSFTRNNSTLPNPFTVGTVRNLAVSQLESVLSDGAFQSSILVTWDVPLDGFVTHYEVQWKRGVADDDYGNISDAATVTKDYGLVTGAVDTTLDWGLVSEGLTAAETYFNSAMTTDQQMVINNVLTTAYIVRVRAVNSFGIRSAWITSSISPVADTTPPGAPTLLVATGGFRQIRLTWDNPSDPDFDIVTVYRNSTNNLSGAIAIGNTRGTSYIDAGLGINQTFYYWVRASDRTGNDSDYTSVASATTAFVDSADFSAEVMNLFSEAGAYGIEPVATLPATGDFDGQIKFDTTSGKLWRWDAAGGVWTDDIFSITSGSVDLASFAAGIEPVSIVAALPNPVGYTGAKVVFLTTDNKLYRYDSSVPEWVSAIPAADIEGALAAANFPSDLRPVEIVNSLPTSGNFDGRQVYLTTDKKVYRYNGTAFVTSVASSDISGTIADAQIAALAASKITGQLTDSQIAALSATKLLDQLTDSQIAAISAAKLTGQITSTQISDNAISTPKLAAGAITSAKIAADTITAANIAAGAITASELATNSVTSTKILAGAVTATQIASGSITSAKIAANAVTASTIASGAITTSKLAAGAVTASTIAADAVTSDKLAANAVVAGTVAAGAISAAAIQSNAVIAGKIAANAVTSTTIAADAITSSKIASNAVVAGTIAAGAINSNALFVSGVIESSAIKAGTIQGDRIAANTITGGLIAAAGVITNSAQIENGLITNAKIANLAVNTAKIADLSVSTLKIGNQAVTIPVYAESASTSVSASITVYETGTKIKISGLVDYANLTGGFRYITIKRGSTTIFQTTAYAIVGASYDIRLPLSTVYMDTVNAGTYTYSITLTSSTGTLSATKTAITLTGIRK